jgi:hypothetical protein
VDTVTNGQKARARTELRVEFFFETHRQRLRARPQNSEEESGEREQRPAPERKHPPVDPQTSTASDGQSDLID